MSMEILNPHNGSKGAFLKRLWTFLGFFLEIILFLNQEASSGLESLEKWNISKENTKKLNAGVFWCWVGGFFCKYIVA